MQETWVQSLDWEGPLEKAMATHSSILAWRIPWTVEPGGLQSTGSQRVRHNLATKQQQARQRQRRAGRRSEGLAAASVWLPQWKAVDGRTEAERQGRWCKVRQSQAKSGPGWVSWDKVRGGAFLSDAWGNAEAFRHLRMCVIWMTLWEKSPCAPQRTA